MITIALGIVMAYGIIAGIMIISALIAKLFD